jgi:hypothetical protein
VRPPGRRSRRARRSPPDEEEQLNETAAVRPRGELATPSRAAAQRAAAAVLLALTGLAVVVGLVGAVVLPAERAGDPAARVTVVAFQLGMALLAVVGHLVVRRRPRERVIGLLLLAAGVLGAAGRAVIGLALADPAGVPTLLAWVTNWCWVPGAAVVLLLLLRFPTGALPSPGWRWAERAVLAWAALAGAVTALVPGDLAVSPLGRRNPLGIEGAGWLELLLSPLFAVLSALTLGCAAALLVRYRRSAGEERQQLRWVAAPVLVLALASPAADDRDEAQQNRGNPPRLQVERT